MKVFFLVLLLAGCGAQHKELEQDSNAIWCLGVCAHVDTRSKLEIDTKEVHIPTKSEEDKEKKE